MKKLTTGKLLRLLVKNNVRHKQRVRPTRLILIGSIIFYGSNNIAHNSIQK